MACRAGRTAQELVRGQGVSSVRQAGHRLMRIVLLRRREEGIVLRVRDIPHRSSQKETQCSCGERECIKVGTYQSRVREPDLCAALRVKPGIELYVEVTSGAKYVQLSRQMFERRGGRQVGRQVGW